MMSWNVIELIVWIAFCAGEAHSSARVYTSVARASSYSEACPGEIVERLEPRGHVVGHERAHKREAVGDRRRQASRARRPRPSSSPGAFRASSCAASGNRRARRVELAARGRTARRRGRPRSVAGPSDLGCARDARVELGPVAVHRQRLDRGTPPRACGMRSSSADSSVPMRDVGEREELGLGLTLDRAPCRAGRRRPRRRPTGRGPRAPRRGSRPCGPR